MGKTTVQRLTTRNHQITSSYIWIHKYLNRCWSLLWCSSMMLMSDSWSVSMEVYFICNEVFPFPAFWCTLTGSKTYFNLKVHLMISETDSTTNHHSTRSPFGNICSLIWVDRYFTLSGSHSAIIMSTIAHSIGSSHLLCLIPVLGTDVDKRSRHSESWICFTTQSMVKSSYSRDENNESKDFKYFLNVYSWSESHSYIIFSIICNAIIWGKISVNQENDQKKDFTKI